MRYTKAICHRTLNYKTTKEIENMKFSANYQTKYYTNRINTLSKRQQTVNLIRKAKRNLKRYDTR